MKKNRLITLLTMGRTVDLARDRKGTYTLRYVNSLSKFRPVARAAAWGAPRAGCAAPLAQASLFGAAKAPAAAPPPKKGADGTDGTNRTNGTNTTNESNGANVADGGNGANRTDPPRQPRPRQVRLRWFAKLGAFLAAAAAFVPKAAARLRARLRSPAADSRPRAQCELALEKLTVLRNDLSDADLVVVAVQPKAEDSRAVQTSASAAAGSTWTRVTARWIKLKRQAEGGRQALEGQGREGGPTPAATTCGGPLPGGMGANAALKPMSSAGVLS